jgi:hypothetical protein
MTGPLRVIDVRPFRHDITGPVSSGEWRQGKLKHD